MPIKEVKVRVLKPGVKGRNLPNRGRDFESTAVAYKPTKKVIETKILRFDEHGKDNIPERMCPASCTHLRQRRKKDPDAKWITLYEESYCLKKSRPSICGNSYLDPGHLNP